MILKKHPGIGYVFLPDLERLKDEGFRNQFWEENLNDEHVMMSPLQAWEEDHIALTQPPLKTKEGWLLLYHGFDDKKVYRVGTALADLEEPWKMIHRSPEYLMKPELPIEVSEGLVANVVFPSGGKIAKSPDGEDQLWIYYGAGDAEIRRATFDLEQLLGYLKQFDKDGKKLELEMIA